MKPLNATLEAMTQQRMADNSQKVALHGSTPTGGHSITIQRPRRPAPLTEGQLTEIASRTLDGQFKIVSAQAVKYGGKLIEGVWQEGQPVGEIATIEVDVRFLDDAPLPMLSAALALSPPESALRHLMHLAIHKKIGSNDADRAILLADYVTALRDFPEFIVYAICRFYWTSDRRPFIPYIDEMVCACGSLAEAFERKRNPPLRIARAAPPAPLPIEERNFDEVPREKWLPLHFEQWITDSEKMIELAKQNPSFLSVETWEKELQNRRAAYASA